jgi:hypothetical protein
MMRIRPFLAIVVLTGLAACASQSDKSVRDEGQKPRPIAAQGERIAPGKCRMVGTLTSIDTTLEATGPCSKAPCRATVRVDSVLGYGSAFGAPVAVAAQIAVHFAFTVAPTTSDLFPNMTERLPGLQVGSKFQTDIESRLEMGSTGNRPTYLIYDYKILR